MTVATPAARTRTPPWRDVRVLRAAAQVVVAVAVVTVVGFLYDNVRTRQRALGIDTTFDFLDQPAGVNIAYSDFRPGQPVRDALAVGVKNTLLVAVVGMALTLVLGTLLGVARLSSNWLVRQAATFYVETLRNIPPLLVIIFVNAAVVLGALPRIQESIDVGGLLILNNRELAVVSPIDRGGAGAFVLALAAGAALAGVVAWWRTRRWEASGEPHHRVLLAVLAFAAVAVVAYAALGGPVDVSRPEVGERSIRGGVAMSTGYAALLTGLVLYTASHVAEIVRGSIEAVPLGQNEAATALGLSDLQRLRYVVLPQAFRIAVPPIINQFLNLTKNTSLGIAVGFSEVTLITRQVIGNGNPAVQAVILLLGIYLVISLVVSLLANVVNRRLQLVER
ncbi:MAG: ABC transporter permease subunit [Acidimicrobiales bacterium]